jgi:hypothetical protein
VRLSAVIAAAAAATLVALPRVALGDPAQEALRLDYHASIGCDQEAQFFAALRARAPRARLAAPGEVARNFNVEIAAGPTRTRARLTIREPNGVKTVREIETKDCREAVDAIALVAALAVDPRALAAEGGATPNDNAPARNEASEKGQPRRGAGAERSGASDPAALPGKSTSAEKGSAEPRGASETGGSAAIPESVVTERAASTALPIDVEGRDSTSTRPFGWTAGAAAAARGGLAPGWLVGGRVGVEIEAVDRRVFSPSLRVWGEYAPRTTFAVEGGSTAFSYGGGTAEICPVAFRAGGIVARPCVVADIGVVAASGIDVPNARSADRFRLAFGGQARVEWRVTSRFGIELDLGCTFPTRRDRYRFDPLLIYTPGAVHPAGSLGANLHFP